MGWSDFADDFSPYLDFEWYATDADGRVAMLSSSGFGPIPLAVFSSRSDYEAVRACLRALPECPVSDAGSPPGPWWTDAVKRGIYVYDWDAQQGQPIPRQPYRRQATPIEPLLADQLPAKVRDWLEGIKFAWVSFDIAEELWPEQAFIDVEP